MNLKEAPFCLTMWKYARVLNIFSHLPSIYNYGYEYLWKLLNDFSHAKQGNGNYVNRVGYDLEKLNISKLFDGQLYLFHPKDTLHFHSEVFHSKMIELKTFIKYDFYLKHQVSSMSWRNSYRESGCAENWVKHKFYILNVSQIWVWDPRPSLTLSPTYGIVTPFVYCL